MTTAFSISVPLAPAPPTRRMSQGLETPNEFSCTESIVATRADLKEFGASSSELMKPKNSRRRRDLVDFEKKYPSLEGNLSFFQPLNASSEIDKKCKNFFVSNWRRYWRENGKKKVTGKSNWVPYLLKVLVNVCASLWCFFRDWIVNLLTDKSSHTSTRIYISIHTAVSIAEHFIYLPVSSSGTPIIPRSKLPNSRALATELQNYLCNPTQRLSSLKLILT